MLLAQSRNGYLRLSELLSRAWLSNQHRGRGEIKRHWFEEGTDGLICLSGAQQGEIAVAMLSGNTQAASTLAATWGALFPGRFYLEIQRAGIAQSEAWLKGAIALAGKYDLPLVATHPVQFVTPDEHTAH